MVVLTSHHPMSSITSTASPNNNNSKANTSPTTTASASTTASSSNGSEFTEEQWLDLLRVLPRSSRTNLQRALKQYLLETEGEIDIEKVDAKIALSDNSTLITQNSIGSSRNLSFLRQTTESERKPLISTNTLDTPNGLDTLAAAALANTNAETNVTSTSTVAVLQGRAVPGTGMLAIPITAQMAPALLSGFKADSSQRQSPTIRETPKRLAATRAEAEQAAVAHTVSTDTAKRSRVMHDNSIDDIEAVAAAVTAASNATNLLLSNGGLPTAPALKPDPEAASMAYSFHGSGNDPWNIPSTSAATAIASGSSSVITETNRRRTRDEGITDDEAARREKRRERNRVAAAKCRQNRQNQIEDLKARRKLLEDEGTQTRQLIDNLKHEKKQIEELLKKHAESGCPTAAQYFQNGTLIIRLSTVTSPSSTPASINAVSAPSLRIIQPTSNPYQLISNTQSLPLNPTIPPTSTNTMIKSEAPNSSPPITFVPVQRPNTLPLVTSTKIEIPTPLLDSASALSNTTSQLAEHLWSPSIAAKIKTPGGDSWVNSQIGLPPSSIGSEKDVGGVNVNATATTTTFLSTPDILHHLGISLAAAAVAKPTAIQLSSNDGRRVTSASVTASSTAEGSTASNSTTNMN